MSSGSQFPPPSQDLSPKPYGAETQPVLSAGESPWLAPASFPSQPGARAADARGERTALYELRPLSTGEVLDRTFSLYRSRFLLFVGISALAATVQLIGQAIQIGVQHVLMQRGNLLTLGLTTNLLALLVSVVFVLAYTVSQAATVWAVGEVYLGRSTTVSESFRATAARWLRYLGIAFWQLGSGAWPSLAVGALVLGLFIASRNSLANGLLIGLLVLLGIGAVIVGFILYLRNFLAVPAYVREELTVRQAMSRSKVLSRGAKGKTFLLLLVAAGLYFVIGALIGAVLMIAFLFSHNPLNHFFMVQIVSLPIGFAGYSLISPVVMIGTTLLYVDQRVRKEAYDVAVLLGDDSGRIASAAGAAIVAREELAPSAFSPAVSVLPLYAPDAAAARSHTVVPGKDPRLSSTDALPEEPAGGASGL